MANTSAPFGFRAFGRSEGGAPTAGMDRLFILSSDTNTYFTGDVVSISSQSAVAGYITLPASGTALGTPVQGIFMGCEYYSPTVARTVWSNYFPGSVGSSSPCNAYVVTDPEQLLIAQGTSAAVLGTSVINYNIGFASSMQSGGNTATGISNVALLSTTVSANSSLPFRIVDTYQNYAPPGVNGTSSGTEGFQIMIVRANNWARNNLTAVST